jgi:hypothetical protein
MLDAKRKCGCENEAAYRSAVILQNCQSISFTVVIHSNPEMMQHTKDYTNATVVSIYKQLEACLSCRRTSPKCKAGQGWTAGRHGGMAHHDMHRNRISRRPWWAGGLQPWKRLWVCIEGLESRGRDNWDWMEGAMESQAGLLAMMSLLSLLNSCFLRHLFSSLHDCSISQLVCLSAWYNWHWLLPWFLPCSMPGTSHDHANHKTWLKEVAHALLLAPKIRSHPCN